MAPNSASPANAVSIDRLALPTRAHLVGQPGCPLLPSTRTASVFGDLSSLEPKPARLANAHALAFPGFDLLTSDSSQDVAQLAI